MTQCLIFKGVTGIVGRAELLGCTFFSLSFLSYHGYVTKFLAFPQIGILMKMFQQTKDEGARREVTMDQYFSRRVSHACQGKRSYSFHRKSSL